MKYVYLITLAFTSISWASESPKTLRGIYFIDPIETKALIKSNPDYSPEDDKLLQRTDVENSKKRWIRITSDFVEMGQGPKSQKIDLIGFSEEKDHLYLHLKNGRYKTKLKIIPLNEGLIRIISPGKKAKHSFAWRKQTQFKPFKPTANKQVKELNSDLNHPNYISWKK